ncbi:MAG: hypothetical protein IT293_12700 [Deltaproteobacteria bacterium]|nr:hypothetical protein [Deltaproteobacteria bacterium]
MTRRWAVTAVMALVGLWACGGGNDDGQDLGNLLDTAQGTQLTAAEHPTGWQRRECFTCHPIEELHRTDHSGTGVLPLEDIRRLVARDRLDSCRLCHGNNGLDE